VRDLRLLGADHSLFGELLVKRTSPVLDAFALALAGGLLKSVAPKPGLQLSNLMVSSQY
jgi:hypothetical protein